MRKWQAASGWKDTALLSVKTAAGVGVATVLPEPDSFVDGVLWRISERDERRLDHYEGFPYLYGKAPVTVTGRNGQKLEVMAYSMNSPYKEMPAMPSKAYLEGHPRWLPAKRDQNRFYSGSDLDHPAGTASKSRSP